MGLRQCPAALRRAGRLRATGRHLQLTRPAGLGCRVRERLVRCGAAAMCVLLACWVPWSCACGLSVVAAQPRPQRAGRRWAAPVPSGSVSSSRRGPAATSVAIHAPGLHHIRLRAPAALRCRVHGCAPQVGPMRGSLPIGCTHPNSGPIIEPIEAAHTPQTTVAVHSSLLHRFGSWGGLNGAR